MLRSRCVATGEVLGNLSDSGLALSCRLHASLDRKAGGRVWFFNKKTAAGPVEPVGGVCPSKEVWETLA